MTSNPVPEQLTGPLPRFLGDWQITMWSLETGPPAQLTIRANGESGYRLEIPVLDEPIEADLTADPMLRHLVGTAKDGTTISVSIWPGTEQDRLVLSLDGATTVIGAKRAQASVEHWTVGQFLLDKTFWVFAQAGPHSRRNPFRYAVSFKPVVDPVGPFSGPFPGLFYIYPNHDSRPYDCLLFEPGNGSLVSINGWRSIALDPTGNVGCLFAMYDPKRVYEAGSAMPFEMPVDDDIAVWGAEEG